MEQLETENKERNSLLLEKNLLLKLMQNADRIMEENDEKMMQIENKFLQHDESKNREILIYRQKVKHLIYEQYERWCKLKAEVTLEKEAQAKKYEHLVDQLQNDKTALKERSEQNE